MPWTLPWLPRPSVRPGSAFQSWQKQELEKVPATWSTARHSSKSRSASSWGLWVLPLRDENDNEADVIISRRGAAGQGWRGLIWVTQRRRTTGQLHSEAELRMDLSIPMWPRAAALLGGLGVSAGSPKDGGRMRGDLRAWLGAAAFMVGQGGWAEGLVQRGWGRGAGQSVSACAGQPPVY